MKKGKGIPVKTSTASLATLKPLTVWITTGNFLKRWEYQTTLAASWEICMKVKKQQLEPDMKQWTGSKQGKEYVKALYCHLAYLTYMQSTSWEMLGWKKHKLEPSLLGEISTTSDTQMTLLLMVESEEELKSLLMKVKEESEKAGLKINIKKIKIIESKPITWWQIEGEKVETVTDFTFLGSKITADDYTAMKLKDACSLEEKLRQIKTVY